MPQPLDVGRESGSLTLSADDTTVEIQSAPGLRQVNAPAGALAAYRFNVRPVSIVARLKRIEPVLSVTDRATAHVEETCLLVSHALDLKVEKAGIVQVPVGKVSFDAAKLHDNASAIIESVIKAKPASCKGRYLKSVTISSTMGPGVKLDAVALMKQWS